MSALPDAAQLHQMAAPHAGVLLVGDFVDAGISRKTMRRLVELGWLIAIRRGAYAVGGRPPNDRQQLVAAYRLAGSGAVVSHWSAARVHALAIAAKGFEPELTMVGRRDPRFQGVRIHVGQLPTSQVQLSGGLRTTTPSRTLVDLAPRLGRRPLEKLMDEGLIAGHWTIDSVSDSLRSVSRRPGYAVVRELVAQRNGGPLQSDSALELRVIRALAACRPFETQYQVVVGGHVFVLDIAWPGLLIAVEAEGWHVRSMSRSKFDHERRKFNLLTAHGWRVLHITAAMSDDEIRAAVFPVLFEAAFQAPPRASR